MRHLCLAALLASAVVGSAGTLDIRVEPTPGLTGFSTYTLAMATEPGEVFRAIDARFSGPLNQVNPEGLSTVYADSNALFPLVGADVRQDSQFLFTTSEVLPLTSQSYESGSALEGVFAGMQRLGLSSPIDFAQVVTDQPDLVDLNFEVDFANTGTDPVRFIGSLSECLLTGCADPNNPGPVDPVDPVDPIDPITPNPIPPGPFDPGPNLANVFVTFEETPGLTGHNHTYTVYIDVGPGGTLRGFDATFYGLMNQVKPFGLSTIFNDNNNVLSSAGLDVELDSQFLISSSSVLSIGAEESDYVLKAAVSGLSDDGLPNPTPIARVVAPWPGDIEFSIAIDAGAADPTIRRSFLFASIYVPEPSAFAIVSTLLLLMRGPIHGRGLR